jgi:phosphohistidine swiveling domain-containing protein
MYFYSNQHNISADPAQIGGKAANLVHLQHMGLSVPKWLVIPVDVLKEILPLALNPQEFAKIRTTIDSFEIPDSFIEQIKAYFKSETYFAVRSSSIDEDGANYSFAGLYESCLYVTAEDLATNIKKVWSSAFSERVGHYRNNKQLASGAGIAVIIQEMVPAEVAGVAFGINPINGRRDEKIISAVYGLGEGLVSGKLDADHYTICDQVVHTTIALKSHQIVFHHADGKGTIEIPVEVIKQEQPTLSEEQVKHIGGILEKCAQEFGRPQDIEFAVADNVIYILQSRPITSINKVHDPNGEYILWDNSNIIESYPGVSTPLTFSFISSSYEVAYQLFVGYLGVSKTLIKKNKHVFANTLGFINGRVYYNLRTWYVMLAMLPGYHINARFMEKMMGVKERFDVPVNYHTSKLKAWLQIIKMAVKMYWRFVQLPRERKKFMTLLNTVLDEYQHIPLEKKNALELMNDYLHFEARLLNEWKAPLLNDLFAMIWFGRLQKKCEQLGLGTGTNIHNDLLCGSSNIISTQPIHRSIKLATLINQDIQAKQLFDDNDPDKIWKVLNEEERFNYLKQEIKQYIHDFGERCIGELKLESISYTQDPRLFIRILKTYVEKNLTVDKTSAHIEETLRMEAEKRVAQQLKGNVFQRIRFNRTLSHARELVSARENLRYERTRAFGVVRRIFTAMGKHIYFEGIMDNPRDIFYLSKEEIFAYLEGRSINQQLKQLIALRKSEFSAFKNIPPPSERFATYGPVYHANDFFGTDKIEEITGDLKGIGCCPGRVKAEAMVVMDPTSISDLNGRILVTSSTDPGWVTLFPSASAIIVERGSLLSHSAIVAREMGIPCIVGVTGLLKRVKSNDLIEMDGSLGIINIIKQDDEG